MSAWHPPWPGFSARGSLLLPLPEEAFAALAAQVDVDGITLARKREFHLTLLDRALGARVQALPLPALFASLDWRWQRRGERWLLREDGDAGLAHSVIELLDLPALEEFRREVGARLGETLPPVPAHVTLYLAGTDIGIGLPSTAAFKRLRVHRL